MPLLGVFIIFIFPPSSGPSYPFRLFRWTQGSNTHPRTKAQTKSLMFTTRPGSFPWSFNVSLNLFAWLLHLCSCRMRTQKLIDEIDCWVTRVQKHVLKLEKGILILKICNFLNFYYFQLPFCYQRSISVFPCCFYPQNIFRTFKESSILITSSVFCKPLKSSQKALSKIIKAQGKNVI